MKLLHLGIPTQSKIENKTYIYVEKIKLHVTSSEDHEFKLQFVCADADSPLPEIVKNENHLAIQVESIEESIKQFDYVAYPTVTINDKLKICFAVKDSILFELTEFIN
jgi:hypothetical protein